MKKGRGAQLNTDNRFLKESHEILDEFLNYCALENEQVESIKTSYLEVFPKTIVNKIISPDVGMNFSMNPYQGCKHGCVYCYARNSHEYWGYSAGLDFEKKILIKKNAADLLRKQFVKKSWKPETIVLSGNTDCYQPAEKQYELTRKCLEVFAEFKNPVGIITKNALIIRDLDVLKELAKDNLVGVNISITTLNESVRMLLEPRTATIQKRFETVKKLSEAGIPVNVMIAPIIPGINSHEIINIAERAANEGAVSIAYTAVRLNGSVEHIFKDWITKALPDRAEKVLNQISELHGGSVNDVRFGTRMKGEGQYAKQIKDMMQLARLKFFTGRKFPELNTNVFRQNRNGQLELF